MPLIGSVVGRLGLTFLKLLMAHVFPGSGVASKSKSGSRSNR
jgi:hypothetical protein